MQKVILQEDVEKLGTRGEIVTVKNGYARNYLLPQKLALEASSSNLKHLDKIRGALAKRTATERDHAQKQADALGAVTLGFTRKTGENDQLFGSVSSNDIAEGLAKQGFQIEKRTIQLEEPIKSLGDYEVTVKLVHGVKAAIKVIVVREVE